MSSSAPSGSRKLSDGAFDVTVGPYVRLWRFARKRKVLPTPAEIATARAAVGWQKLRLDPRARTVTLLVPNMRLDLGSIGKGYAADQALQILKGRGIDRALVAASGDIAVGNPPPGQRGWKVGIARLWWRHQRAPLAPLLLHNAGISTSGDTEQFIEINGVHYSHIVNPATGLGLTPAHSGDRHRAGRHHHRQPGYDGEPARRAARPGAGRFPAAHGGFDCDQGRRPDPQLRFAPIPRDSTAALKCSRFGTRT